MTEDATAITGRLDKIDNKLDGISEALTIQVTMCAGVRGQVTDLENTVYGNGRDGMIREMEQLKTVRAIRGKGFWALVALASSIISGAILLGGRYAVALIGG